MKQKQKQKPNNQALQYLEHQIEQIFEEITNETANLDNVSKENIAFNVGRLFSLQKLLTYIERQTRRQVRVEFTVSIKKG